MRGGRDGCGCDCFCARVCARVCGSEAPRQPTAVPAAPAACRMALLLLLGLVGGGGAMAAGRARDQRAASRWQAPGAGGYFMERGHDHFVPPQPPPPAPTQAPETGKSEALQNYYEFLVNEGSYKFWAVFEVVTAALLIYSAFAAVYYAKYTYATTEADYDYWGFARRQGEPADFDDDGAVDTASTSTGGDTFLGLSAATFQRIMDAISSKKYS